MKPVQFAHIHTTGQYRAAMGCQDLQALNATVRYCTENKGTPNGGTGKAAQ